MHLYILSLLILSILEYVLADCHYWDGTAPFCGGSCPSGCIREATSRCGNGACCWTGRKALCNCCGGGPDPGPCTPTQTEAFCFGGGFLQPITPLICRNVELTAWPPPERRRTCSTSV